MSIAVTLLPGDGIGPEIVRAARRVVDATGVRVDWEEMAVGEQAYRRQGTPVPEEVLASARRTGLMLKGPLTNPGGTPYGSPTITLRRRLGLFASVRFGRAGPGVPSRFPGMDLAIVREITEDFSAEASQPVGDHAGIAIRVITRPASLRIARFAFELARRLGRRRITVAHVATNFKTTDGLFLAAVREVAAAYPDIDLADELLDTFCLHLMRDPAQVDTLLTPNFYGNFLSGLIAGMAGSVGMQSGADYGEGVTMFEAGHGALPRHAGKDMANPSGLILSAALLLERRQITIGELKMGKTDIFIIPVAPVRQRAAVARTRKAVGTGIRFGVLDNGKANADHLLSLFVEGLRAVLPVSSVISLRKPSAAAAAADAILERLAAEADFVVSAMAD